MTIMSFQNRAQSAINMDVLASLLSRVKKMGLCVFANILNFSTIFNGRLWDIVKVGSGFGVLVMILNGSALCATTTNATVNVYFSDVNLANDFVANATNYYQGSLSKSAFFTNTYSFTVTAKKAITPPPITPQPINDATAFQQCYSYGWAFGVDWERTDDLKLLREIQSMNSQCSNAFDVLASTISEKNGTVLMVPASPAQ